MSALRRSPTGAAVAAAVGVLAVAVTALVVGRHTWFFADDWNAFELYGPGRVLEPFNGHLSLVPAAVFAATYRVAGVGSYVPFRVLALVGVAVLAAGLFRYAASRVGGRWGAVVVLAVVWNAAGASNLLFPFLINFSIPLAALVSLWWHLDRRGGEVDRHLRWASWWLAVALASSGIGLVALGAVVVELAVRRASWRTWAVMAPGPVLWAVWYLANRDATTLADDPGAVATYAARMLLGAGTALAGGWGPGGMVALVALVACVLWRVVRGEADVPRVLAAASAPLAFVVLTALTRSQTVPAIPPDELRYAWTLSLLLVLVLVAAWAPSPVSSPRAAPGAPRPPAALVAGAVAVLLVAGGVQLVRSMGDWASMVADAAPGIRSNLYAAEAVGAERVDPDRVLPLSFELVTAGAYLDAVDAVGSPVAQVAGDELGGEPLLRVEADRLLVEELGIRAVPSSAPARCDPVDPAAIRPGSTVLVRTAPDAGGAVAIARFSGDRDARDLGATGAGWWRVELPADAPGTPRQPVPYRLVAGGSPVQVCAPG